MRGVGHPGVCLPDRLTLEPDGDVVARGTRVAGIDLASLMRIRGPLDAGECVAVGVDVADALAALHSAGIVHGDLSPANVVATPQRVVLIDLVGGAGRGERGTPGFSAPERPVGATPACDVYSLGRLLSFLADEEARERIDAWAAPLTAPAAASRPPAREVAAALLRCAAPVPVRVPDVGVAAAVRARALSPEEVTLKTPAGRPWRVRRAVVRLGVVGGVAAGAFWVLVALNAIVPAPPHGSGAVRPPTLPIPADLIAAPPADAASALTLSRFEAIAASDAEALLATTVEGSEARTADERLSEGLATGVIRFESLGVEVDDATVVTAKGNSATVRVTYVITAHEAWDGSTSAAVAEETASAELGIRWTRESGWRVETALALP